MTLIHSRFSSWCISGSSEYVTFYQTHILYLCKCHMGTGAGVRPSEGLQLLGDSIPWQEQRGAGRLPKIDWVSRQVIHLSWDWQTDISQGAWGSNSISHQGRWQRGQTWARSGPNLGQTRARVACLGCLVRRAAVAVSQNTINTHIRQECCHCKDGRKTNRQPCWQNCCYSNSINVVKQRDWLLWCQWM